MKKVITVLLALVLVMSMMVTGCKKDEVKTTDNNSTNDGVTAEDAKDSEEDGTKDSETTKVNKDDITVGFVFVGPVGDGGWTYAHNEGRLYIEEQLGVKTLFNESVKETQECEQVMRDMIDQGANVIFATSFGYMKYVKALAEEYPDVKFFHCSGFEKADNMSNYFGRIYQSRYLSGIVAGLKTESNKIGYVAAFSIPEVVRGINAFTLGAQSVNPDVEVEVVWTSTWYDPAKEKEAAIALLDKGCDVIAQHQDTAGPQQAAEERGKYSIGYNTDMQKVAQKANMTSAIWNWGPYYIDSVQSVIDGTFESTSYWGGLNEGIVGLVPLTDVAPEDAKSLVEDATDKIKDGSLHVFEGPIYNQEGELAVKEGEALTDAEMLSINWFVKGVIGKIQE
ncbi:MAG: BMP family ABC transporter substrate-binding protein [Vallitalea sp.]|jgi:basic membrane protein A|nr:BMP family ABC transporter substrate-binding protein [Vallitalea sp.]